MATKEEPFPLMLLGSNNVGKTAFALRFQGDAFDESYTTDHDTIIQQEIVISDDICIATIVDTHCTGEFTAMRELRMKNCKGILLTYSITSRKSFDDIPNEYEQILRVHDVYSFPVVVLGCKSDLEHERQVERQEAQEMATIMGGIAIETSAKENTNIQEAVSLLIQLIIENETTLSKSCTKGKRKCSCM